MAATVAEAAAHVALVHTDSVSVRAEAAGEQFAASFRTVGGLDDDALARWLQLSVSPAMGVDRGAHMAGSGYVRQIAKLYQAPVGVVPLHTMDRLAYIDRMTGAMIAARTAAAEGASFDDAMEAGAARAKSLVRSGYGDSSREGARATMEATEGVESYRRVPDSAACKFCRTIATRTYFVADLAPVHVDCGCGVMPLFGDARGSAPVRPEAPKRQPKPKPEAPPAPEGVTFTTRKVNYQNALAATKKLQPGEVLVITKPVAGHHHLAQMDAAVGFKLPNGISVLRQVDASMVRLAQTDLEVAERFAENFRPGGAFYQEVADTVEAGTLHRTPPIKEMVYSLERNPGDTIFAERTGIASFESAATARGTTVTNYSGRTMTGGTFRHESGHVVETIMTYDEKSGFSPALWRRSMDYDAKVSGSARNVELDPDLRRDGHKITLGEAKGITTYGQTNYAEDLAEAYRMYAYDVINGRIGTRVGTGEALRFHDLFPARASIFDKHLARRIKPGLKLPKWTPPPDLPT